MTDGAKKEQKKALKKIKTKIQKTGSRLSSAGAAAASRQESKKTHTANAGKSRNPKLLNTKTKQAQLKAVSENALPRFMYNMSEGMMDAFTFGAVSRTNIREKGVYYDALHSGLSAKLGRLTGESSGYLGQYALAGPFIGRISNSIMKMTTSSLTIGVAQNIGIANGKGLKDKEFAKDVAINTGIDLALGAIAEGGGGLNQ